MVVENSWAETGEVGEVPVAMHPSVPPDDLLYSSPSYTNITDDLSNTTQHRTLASSPSVKPRIEVNNGSEDWNDWNNDDGNVAVHSHVTSSISPCFGEDDDVALCLPPGISAEIDPFFVHESDAQIDDKDSSAVPGVCGLRNLGNTCFMSAGLQCLSNTPTLLHFFVSHPSLKIFPTNSLTSHFSTLFQRMWSGENRVVHPVEFKQSLGTNYPQFKDYRQHDCQEFLALLLDSLHEQLNTVGQTSPRNPEQAQSMDRFSNSSLSHSSENSGDAHNSFRIQPIPETVAPFRLAELSNGTVSPAIALNYALRNEKNQLASQVNCTSNTTHVHNLKDILKDAKTSNVNVLVEDQEANNTIRYDSEKFPRHEHSNSTEVPNPNLLELFGFDNKSVSVKRIKDTNLLQDNSDGEGSESGGLDLKRIKLTDQNNCRVERNNTMLEDNETASSCMNLNLQKQSNSDLSLSYVNGVNKVVEDGATSAPSSTSGQPTDADDCLTMESFPDSTDGQSNPVHGSVKDDLLADQHWEKHLSSNQSTIVDTFLGQFKSTVVCSECKHVSVTYEPFMYLSVPLPHAMEKQIRITFVPVQSSPAVQYLITMNKQDKVRQLREEIVSLRQKEGFPLENNTLVFAEVLENHIAKFLDDASPLRHVNDINRSIYALEVSPPPEWYSSINESKETIDLTENVELPSQSNLSDPEDPPPFSPAEPEVEVVDECDDKLTADSAGVSDNEISSSDEDELGDKSGSVTGAAVCSIRRPSPILRSDGDGLPDSSIYSSGLSPMHGPHLPSASVSPLVAISEFYDLPSRDMMIGCDRGDDWKNCAICLEDMNNDMRRHVGCDCVLCEGCIENACKHNNSKDEMPCPVCNQIVKPNSDFVRIDKLSSAKPTVRLLNVPVVFRLDIEGDGNNNKKSMKLFGHPNVLRLPSVLPASELTAAISKLVHTSQEYSILTVDGVGYRCSRCLYTKHCHGCRVSLEGEVVLRSADTLAVRFMEPVEDPETVQHSSLQNMRSTEPLTLYDCLKAFSESELLDEHNPWYCPSCRKSQCATKTLSVWRYPDFLIVYLKRFVFHNGMSTKLDNKVTYPINGLVVNSPTSSTPAAPHIYNLYACVCHYGGVSAGHYTAYAKNPMNSEWHYFNDETVCRQKPQEDDYSNAYVLFYQKQGVAFPELSLEEPMKPNIDRLIERLDSTMDQDIAQEPIMPE